MKVGYSPILKIDPEFKSLMHPLSEKEFLSLRENILDGGATYSIAAWNEYLIDGYERYMICRQENIPYHVHRIGFSCREHAITWICREQLKKEISPMSDTATSSGNDMKQNVLYVKIPARNPISNPAIASCKIQTATEPH